MRQFLRIFDHWVVWQIDLRLHISLPLQILRLDLLPYAKQSIELNPPQWIGFRLLPHWLWKYGLLCISLFHSQSGSLYLWYHIHHNHAAPDYYEMLSCGQLLAYSYRREQCDNWGTVPCITEYHSCFSRLQQIERFYDFLEYPAVVLQGDQRYLSFQVSNSDRHTLWSRVYLHWDA